MRLIVVGCENVGKTTLVNNLQEWGKGTGFHFHMDDHFTIPDAKHLSDDERQRMMDLGPVMKERYQRFQIYYHLPVLHRYDHVLITGFHIEESVYGPKYYYDREPPGLYPRKIEHDFPEDTILVLLKAKLEVLGDRMKKSGNPFPVVAETELEEVSKLFEAEYGRSWMQRKVQIDTSDLSPSEVLDECLRLIRPQLSSRDLLRLG